MGLSRLHPKNWIHLPWTVENKMMNNRIKDMAKKFGDKHITVEKLQDLLFWAASSGMTFSQVPISGIATYEEWSREDYPYPKEFIEKEPAKK